MRNREKLPVLWRRFCIKLQGHIRYFGVSFNLAWVEKFIQLATRILFKWLNRRSQRKSFTWEQLMGIRRAREVEQVGDVAAVFARPGGGDDAIAVSWNRSAWISFCSRRTGQAPRLAALS